jgi:hypothetical protein
MNADLLHTIARRDRAAEAAARCGDSPARPVSGLISSACLTKRIALSIAPSRIFRCSGYKRSDTLIYRCGGSAGFGVFTSPASRFTRGVNRRAPDAPRL